MKRYINMIFLWVFCIPLMARKTDIKGSGYILTQERKTAFFENIDVSSHISIYIVQGEFKPITVEADNNLFDYIKTEVQNNTLKVYIPDSINIVKFTHMNILISMPKINTLQARQISLINAAPQLWKVENINLLASSGSKIHLAVQASKVKTKARTSAIIELKGKADTLDVELEKAAKLYARHFKVENALLNLQTHTKAEIIVDRTLKYDLQEHSRLIYKGNPKIVEKNIDSTSKITQNL